MTKNIFKRINLDLLSCLLVVLGASAAAAAPAATVEVTQLRCEQLADPLGIDVTQPRLSWQLSSAERGVAQTAYELLVASSAAKLTPGTADLWESGKVASAQAIHVRYAGQPLISRQVCFWQVRIWDQSGNVSAWSPRAVWSLGLLQPADWRGQWIGKDEVPATVAAAAPGVKRVKPGPDNTRRLATRMLRKEFTVTKPVARATAYFSGLGLSELYLNGRKVGDQVLSPALSDYSQRVFYVTHDVTAQLQRGPNALGVWLGNGRFYAPRTSDPAPTTSYGFPKLMLQLEIDYVDGTRDTVVSDASWKLTTNGPISANNEYDGEEYDARQELPGWASAGFAAAAWSPAQVVAAPGGKLVAPMIAPIRVTGTLKPIAVTEPKPGVFIYDLGQNMVGWCRLQVSGPAGTQVTLRHAEILKADGTLYLDNLRRAKVTDSYTLSGRGSETYEPRFTYHGFRYVEVTGFPGRPTLAALEGRVVNDDLATAGEFTCSQPTINQVYRNIVWGTRGNYRSVPTDCPQRDERQAWLGDRAAESKGETYLFDTGAFYAKWCQDMADTQQANGSISDVCPEYWRFYSDNVTWPSCVVIIPGTLLEQYGDTATLARLYPAMVKWVDLMSRSVKDGLTSSDKYGDWCVPPEDPKAIHAKDPARKTAKAVLATSYLYHCLKLLAGYAKLLDKPTDAQRFTALAETLKTAFNAKLYNQEKGYYDNGTQTSCVLPLAFDLVPAAERPRVFAHLVKKIEGESRGHVGTGLIGGQWINRVLTEGGRPDLVYRFATNTDYPSWGYMAAKGATTIWELWNGDTANPAMNSGNHVMLVGDLAIWFYEDLAGIKADPAQPGFKHIVMQPHPVGDLTFVRATHRSPYGLISSEWKRDAGTFTWHISVPPNTTATVYVPATNAASITETGQPAAKSAGVKFLRQENGAAVYEVGSGAYSFTSTLPAPEPQRFVPAVPVSYPDQRPGASWRLDAVDQGVVLKHGDGPGQCDILGAREALIFAEKGVYHLFYDGAGPKGWLACLATSKDLKTWEKKGPVLDFGKPGEMDSAAACSPWVYNDGQAWHMFYLGTQRHSGGQDKVPSTPYMTMKAKSGSLGGPWVKQPEVIPFRTKPGTYYAQTASPGHIVKQGDEYLQFFSAAMKRTLGIARTKDLNGAWTIDPQPIVPPEEQIENSSLYFEPANQTWFLFTNHIGLEGFEYTDAVWVYWTKDLNKWHAADKAVVLDGKNCTWSKKCIGMPSVVVVGKRLAIFYDAPGGDSKSHMRRDVGLAWLELPLTPPAATVK